METPNISHGISSQRTNGISWSWLKNSNADTVPVSLVIGDTILERLSDLSEKKKENKILRNLSQKKKFL